MTEQKKPEVKAKPPVAKQKQPPHLRWRSKANLAMRIGRRFAKAVERVVNTRGYTPTDDEHAKLCEAINETAARISRALRASEPTPEEKDLF